MAKAHVDRGELEAAREPLVAAGSAAGHFSFPDPRLGETLEVVSSFVRAAAHDGDYELATETVRAIVDAAPPSSQMALFLFRLESQLYADLGRKELAVEAARQRTQLAERQAGVGSPLAIEAMMDHADVQLTFGDSAAAMPLAREAAERSRDAFGPRSPQYALALSLLASVRIERGELEAGLTEMEHAAEIAEEAPPRLRQRVVLRLASAYRAAARPEKVVETLEVLLRLGRTAGGPDSPTVAYAEAWLGSAQRDLGEVAAGKPHLDRATRLARRNGLDLPLAMGLGSLFELAELTGEQATAREHRDEVIDLFRRASPSTRSATLLRMTAAPMALEERDWKEGAGLMLDGLARAEAVLGPESISFAGYRNNLAWVLARANDPNTAEPHALAALEYYEQRGRRTGTAMVKSTLGQVRLRQRRYEEAAALLESAAAELESILGPRAPKLVQILEAHAEALVETGALSAARSLDERAMELRRLYTQELAALPAAGTLLESREDNFRIEVPSGWVEIDSTPFGAETDFALLLAPPGVIAAIGAYPVDVSRPDLVAALESFATGQGGRLVAQEPLTIASIPGVLLELEMPVPGRVMRRLTWIGLNRGLAYELIVLGDQSEIELPQLRGYADELWAGFALIDPEAGAVDPVPLEAVFRSPTFGYTVELTDPEWERWPDAAGTVVGAEFGATHPLGVMVVIPIALLGVDPTQEGVAAAFSRVLDLADGGDTRPVRVGPLTGIDVEGQRAAAEPLRERTRILVGEASAFAVTVVMSEETARLDELLGEVRAFSLETDPVLETSADVPESLRLGHAIFFAALASHQRRSGRLADAETTMERSVELAPSDPSALAILAAIQLERARYAAAVATYEQVFAGDYSNVDAVEGYVSALLELGRPDEALEVLDEQIRRSGSGQLRLTRAVVLAQQGDLARATAELESLEREGYASVLLYELMFAFYLEQDRPADVLDTLGRLDERTRSRPGLLGFRAEALAALERFCEGREALDRALADEPGNERLQEVQVAIDSELQRRELRCD